MYLFAGVEQGAYGGVYGDSAVDGVFGPFSRSSGRPGVSASFSSPRALTPVSARGLLPITIVAKIITDLTRYRPIVLELI